MVDGFPHISPFLPVLRIAPIGTVFGTKEGTDSVNDGGGGVMMSLLEWKQCKRCGKTFVGSAKRKFCSKQFRVRFHNRLSAIKRMLRDAEFKQRSLARLYAWKERRKREREAQRQAERKQQVVQVDAFWI